MADTVDKVAERLTRLEVTVAEGFHDNGLRFQKLETQLQQTESRLTQKIDATADSLRREIRALLNAYKKPPHRRV